MTINKLGEVELMEKPAQQAQMQNGEQASLWSVLCDCFVTSHLATLCPFRELPLSEHGITLQHKTNIANINAAIFFTGAKVAAIFC